MKKIKVLSFVMRKMIMVNRGLFLLFICVLTHQTNAQTYFRSKYIFKSSKFQMFRKKSDDASKSIADGQSRLVGNIISHKSDTLVIRFWDILNTTKHPDRFQGASNSINSGDNGKDFYYQFSGNKMKVPFSFRMLAAANIPFKVGLKDDKVTADFLNFGVSHFWIRGRTKFYSNEFVPTRDRYVGIGPYVGLSSIDDPDSEDNQFGLSYGVNAIISAYDLNFVIAFGADTGFKSNTNSVQPYLGFGIGFKLLEITTPKDQSQD
jgi:hypothetical protein